MIGTRLAHYEITKHLGTGGMGEVYQATDSKLGRSVAIKLLPAAVASDADRLSRFRREAQVLASLNHSNIAQIYGIEESGETRCIVMELVEGETLQARIKRGPVPVAEALAIVKQVAEALEAAHEKGVVHRDLKPGNVMLTGEGKVKVLDFGLAKASEASTSNASLSNSPTMASMGATNTGMILGTAAYMSPEQAKGRTVDSRTDVFALGCVFYEMLTGRAAFDGEDVTEILSRILQREPDWTLLPTQVPPRVRELLRLCLEKNVKNRRQTAADVRIDIEQALTAPQPAVEGAPVRARASRGPWIIAAVALLGAAALAIPAIPHLRETPPPELRVDINTPPTTDPLSMALSPNAQWIVFVASDGGQQKLWLRSMESVEAHVLAGTDGASFPFWSPDNRSIGFFADSKLKRIDVAGGTVQTLANAAAGRGGSWSDSDIILFSPSVTGSLMRVPAVGGQPVAVTRLQSQQNSHRFPRFLPDNRHFLYYVNGYSESGGSVYVGSLENESENHRLLQADVAAEFDAGHLLFVRQGTIFAQRLDLKELKLEGDPFPVSEKVAVDQALGAASMTVSASGPIAFRAGGGALQLVWFDRSGNEVATIGPPDMAGPSSPDLSPDGNRLAYWRAVNGNADVWIAEIEHGLLSRFTLDPAADLEPIWSADGEAVFFASNRKGLYNLYRKAVNGAGTEDPLLETPFSKRPLDVSRDGRFLLYGSIEPNTAYDVLALSLTDNRKTIPVAQTMFEERDGQFSPNGNWVAYRSNESGRLEIYVKAFPGPGEKRQISTDGGVQPRWSADGKELFYIGLDSRLMAVSIRAGANNQPLETGAATALFATRIALAPQRTVKHQYAVSRDGKRFLINSSPKDAVAAPITLILNWNPGQKK